MKIFDHHATLFLLEKLNSIRYFHSSWRSIHLQMSGKKERYNRTMRIHFILKGFQNLLAEDEGYVYLCEDGDIIILFEGRVTPMIKKLARYFGDLDAEYGSDTLDHFFRTYDLSKDWGAFSHMCHIKSLETDLWDRRVKSLQVSQLPWEQVQAP